MKKKLFFVAALCAITLLFSNCKKESASKTSLSILVMDELQGRVRGVSVSLYSTETDRINQTNSIGQKTTDGSGTAKFDGLSANNYYWFVKKDCINNALGNSATTVPITENLDNKVMAVLEATGAMKFTNNSTNPYKIYVDGIYLVDVAGGATHTLPYYKTGTHSVRVLQISGNTGAPMDKTYTEILNCGGTFTTTFPN